MQIICQQNYEAPRGGAGIEISQSAEALQAPQKPLVEGLVLKLHDSRPLHQCDPKPLVEGLVLKFDRF